MITQSIVLDLRRDSESADRRELGALYGIPAGSRVIVKVADRSLVAIWTVDQLRQYVDTLHFDVQGSTEAVAAWAAHLRGADPYGLRRPA